VVVTSVNPSGDDTPRGDGTAGHERPRHRRSAVRVVLTDESGRFLLFEDSDPGIPGARWWMTPGGGIDPGETQLEAAVRELREETGLVLAEDQLLGPVALRTVRHGYSDRITEQAEWFFLASVPAFVVDIAGHTEDERQTVLGHRWWEPAALSATGDLVWPADLIALAALRGEPARWPVDLGTVEESTVPI
jgi:8-oxo-dGTP pyrophosphatase MutT (NUDIX family)